MVVGATVVVVTVVSTARATTAEWGQTVEVIVVAHDLSVGEPLVGSLLEKTVRPAAFVPDDALVELPDPNDVALRTVRSGEVLTERDLRSMRTALDLPSGHQAISLPLDPTVPHLVIGDVVDVYLVDDRFATITSTRDVDAASPQTLVVPRSVVVDTTDDAVIVAIDRNHVGAVAATAVTGRVILALR